MSLLDCATEDPFLRLESTADFDLRLLLSSTMLQQLRSREDVLAEADLLADQNELLKDIRDRLNERKSTCFLTESDDAQSSFNKSSSLLFRPVLASRRSSMECGLFTQRTRSGNETTQGRFRRRAAPTSEEIEDLMREVHVSCRSDIYDTLSWVVRNMRELGRKVTENDNSAYQLEKEKRAHQLLKNKQVELQKKLMEAESRLRLLEDSAKEKEAAETAKKHQIAGLHERERALIRSQGALLMKEKVLAEDMKRLNTKFANLAREEKQQAEERVLLDELWQDLLTKIQETNPSPFLQHVYAKCKDNLLKQRKALLDEQNDLDRQHSTVLRLIEQLQRLEAA